MRVPLLAAVGVLAAPCAAHASTFSVELDGSGDYTVIQDAIDAALDGDQILVGPGTHVGLVDYQGKALELAGTRGRGSTVLDGGCLGRFVVDLEDTPVGTLLEEVTVTGACVLGGGGASFAIWGRDSSAIIRGVVVRDNMGWAVGTGAPCDSPGFTIRDSAFVDNFGSPAQAVLVLQCPTVVDTVLIAGNVINRAIEAWHPQIQLSHVVINQPDSIGIDVLSGGSPVIRNVTVNHGSSGYAGGLHLRQYPSTPLVTSSVFSGATVAALFDTRAEWSGGPAYTGLDQHYTDLWPFPGSPVVMGEPDPTGTLGNISADPLYVSWTDDGDHHNDDLCLAPGSPGIDAGDPDPAFNDDDGTRNDLGAFGGPGAPSCAYMTDSDADGFEPIAGDCDDTSALVFPFAPEVVCDGIDQDCDGADPVGDPDEDGFLGTACGGLDCGENDPSVFPGAPEIECDGIDQDCDGADALTDADGDGHPAADCAGDDCDDDDPAVHPDAPELCDDGVDNDCADGDRRGDEDGDGASSEACGGDDCDDGDPDRFPAATDVECDGVDQDCDGSDAQPPGGCGDDDDDSADDDDDSAGAADDDDSAGGSPADPGCTCTSAIAGNERTGALALAFALGLPAVAASRRRRR